MHDLEMCPHCGRAEKKSIASMRREMLKKIGYEGPERQGSLTMNVQEITAIYIHIMTEVDKKMKEKHDKKKSS